jgi:citrate lyase subunit beta / citryl-CoA lyase
MVSRKEFVLLLLNDRMRPFAHRSLLFVPAGDARKIARAGTSDADAVILDWEDGTAAADKSAARETTAVLLAKRPCRQPVWVRINSVRSEAYMDDERALEASLPDGIVVPKCESADDVFRLIRLLDQLDREHTCGVMPMIESSAGLLAAPEIARCSPRVVALGFGAEDFVADSGALPGPDGRELLFARSALVVASRAASIEPVDSPSLEYRDLEFSRAAALDARRLGFSGKMAIHPDQVAAINESFTPSAVEVEHARAVIAEFESQPKGSIAFRGAMIDEAVIRRARRLLARTDRK